RGWRANRPRRSPPSWSATARPAWPTARWWRSSPTCSGWAPTSRRKEAPRDAARHGGLGPRDLALAVARGVLRRVARHARLGLPARLARALARAERPGARGDDGPRRPSRTANRPPRTHPPTPPDSGDLTPCIPRTKSSTTDRITTASRNTTTRCRGG